MKAKINNETFEICLNYIDVMPLVPILIQTRRKLSQIPTKLRYKIRESFLPQNFPAIQYVASHVRHVI